MSVVPLSIQQHLVKGVRLGTPKALIIGLVISMLKGTCFTLRALLDLCDQERHFFPYNAIPPPKM